MFYLLPLNCVSFESQEMQEERKVKSYGQYYLRTFSWTQHTFKYQDIEFDHQSFSGRLYVFSQKNIEWANCYGWNDKQFTPTKRALWEAYKYTKENGWTFTCTNTRSLVDYPESTWASLASDCKHLKQCVKQEKDNIRPRFILFDPEYTEHAKIAFDFIHWYLAQ